MRILLTLLTFSLLSVGGFSVGALAQDVEADTAAQESTAKDAEDFEQRYEIAREMHKLRPVKTQVDNAIETVAARLPQAQRENFRMSMKNVLNYNAIEKVSVNAMAETFTLAELEAMLEYNKKPEAISANQKFSDYQAKVGPEIVRMIDKAMMRIRTGTDQ